MNRLFFLTAIFWFLFSNSAIGQIDALEITGPHEVELGALVRLVPETEPEETPFWLVLAPNDLDYEQVDNGRRLIFSAGCTKGQKIVVLLLAQQVKDDRIVTRQVRRTIEVSGDEERCPDPPMNPPSDKLPEDGKPKPPIEDWASSPIFTAAKKAMPLVLPAGARQLGLKVAENFDFVAHRCRAGGEIKTKAEIWQQVSKLNRETLGELSPAWTPFGRAIQVAFQNLNLTDVDSHGFHLRAAALAIRQEIATDLRDSRGKRWSDPVRAQPHTIHPTNSRLP